MRLPIQGENFERNGAAYEIVYATIDTVRFSDLRSHNIRTETLEDFIDFLLSASGKVKHPFMNAPEILIGSYSAQDRQIMMERYELILHVESKAQKMASKPMVEPLLEEFSQTTGSKLYSFQAFYRLYTEYKKTRDITCLLPKVKNRGQKKKVYSEEIEELIRDNIFNYYLTGKRNPAQHCFDMLEAEYLRIFGELPLHERPELISRSGYYRRIKDLDQYTVVKEREGKTKANKLFRCKGISEEISRVLQRVEADGNYLDVLIVDPDTGLTIGRPLLTVFIDVMTRCILSFEVSISGFSAASLLRAFKGALATKNQLPGGRMEKLYIDNGSDYISESFLNACSSLKLHPEQLSPRTPNAKSHVERFFRTLNENLIHKLEGTTFSNPQQKGEDYKPEKLARLTIDEVRVQIENYIHSRYHITPHRTTMRAPIEYWEELNKEDPASELSADNVDTICRLVDTRVVSNSRVQYQGLYFTSASLAEVEHRQKSRRRDAKVDQNVEIYVDESDLSYVLVRPLDIANSPFLKAYSTRPEYTRDLSIFEHRLITKALNDAGKKDFAKHTEQRLMWLREHMRTVLSAKDSKSARRQLNRLPELEEDLKEIISRTEEDYSEEKSINVQPTNEESHQEDIDEEILIEPFKSEEVDMNSKGAANEK